MKAIRISTNLIYFSLIITALVDSDVFEKFKIKYRQTAVSTGNTFQDLPRSRETADIIEHYI